MRFFRIDAAGRIVGISDMDEATAQKNLGEGERLLPFDPAVSVRGHFWTGETWAALPPEPDRIDDWVFMRATGYPSVGDQLGAIMKVLAEPAGADARCELDSLLQRIAEIKAAHPKPSAV